jgi:hypothetical protein
VTITILGFALAAGVMRELPSSQQNGVALPNQKTLSLRDWVWYQSRGEPN